MRILLSRGLALELLRDAFEPGGKLVVDDIAGGTTTSVASIDELDGADGGGQGDGGEIEHAFRLDDLAILEREAIGLERTEGLLDPPAQTIELHDFLGLDGVADRERGQEAPQQRSGARWCLDFSCLHQSELDGFGHAGYTAVLRAGNAYGSGAQFHLGDSSLVARPARRHAYLTGYQSSGSAQGLEQPPACGQPAILPGADDQIEPFRLGAEERIDIAFAVGDHRHRGGFEQTLRRSLAARTPARRFLVLEAAAAARPGARLRAGPDRRIDEPDHSFGFDIHGDHRVNEKSRRLAVACRPEAASLLLATGKIDFGGVLHCQDAATGALCRRARAQGSDDPIHGNVGRRQETTHPHLACARLPELAQHHGPHRRDPLDHPIRASRYPNIPRRHRKTSRNLRPKALNLICNHEGITFVHPVAPPGGGKRARRSAANQSSGFGMRPCEKELADFPEEVRGDLADALAGLDQGLLLSMPLSRPTPSIGRGVHELRLRHRSGIYRAIYC